MRRAGVVALACLAFALGAGAGAYLASAHAAAASPRVVVATVGQDYSQEVAARGPDLPAEVAAPVEVISEVEADVHTVARTLSLQPVPSAYAAPQPSAPVMGATRPGALAPAHVTFYYCAGGGAGDGGGFCGSTADGSAVQIGVAACDPALLGQQFRVLGDPSGLLFRCADTGGAVYGPVRDIWFPTAATGGAWLAGVGHQVVIEVME